MDALRLDGAPAKLLKRTWQGYSASTADEDARALFLARFGRQPAELRRNGGAVLAGPLTLADLESKKNGGRDVG